MDQEVRYRHPGPAGEGVSNVEVENVMKMLMAYQKARAEGIGQPNPELDTLLEAMQSGLPKDYPTDGPIDEAMKIPSHATQPALAPTSDEIIPKPFFVLKTKNEKQQKVFINVCGSHKIGTPDYGEETIETIDELKTKLQRFDPSEDPDCPDLRFPCSCLDPVFQKDKKGKTYAIYDVCYNRTVVESAMSVKTLKVFIIDMALTWLSQKYKTQLSVDFKILERKYKGKEVGKHRIRIDPKKGPIISELRDDDEDAEPTIPLLLRDKQGRGLPDDAAQENCKLDEGVDPDRYFELPEWVPDFHASDADGRTEVAPKNQPVITTGSVESKTLETSASSEPVQSLELQDSKFPQEILPTQSSPAEPWLPSAMFRELNTPQSSELDLKDPCFISDLNTSSCVPSLESSCKNLEAPIDSKETIRTTAKRPTTGKFKFKELKKEVEMSGDCGKSNGKDVPQKPLPENLLTPKVQVEYVGRPVVTVFTIVTFPVDFIGLEDMHVHMTSNGIFIDTEAYGLLEVKLQFYVSPMEVQAEYSKTDRILKLDMPFLSYAQALKLRLA